MLTSRLVALAQARANTSAPDWVDACGPNCAHPLEGELVSVKAFISIDMEGVAGVATFDQVARGGHGYPRARTHDARSKRCNSWRIRW